MADNTTQQIAELNQKVDTILEYVNQQRLKSQALDDLVADVSIIGKDAYDSTVKALDEHEVVLDPDQLRELGIRVAQNVGNFNAILDTMGSAMDLMKDVGPIANEVIIDGTKMLHELKRGDWGRLIISSCLFPRYDIGDLVEAMGKNYFRVIGRAKPMILLEHRLYRLLFGWLT